MNSILEKMQETCTKNNLYPTANIEKIARAKMMMFGENEWSRCPCDGNNPSRFCLSEMCKADIASKGVCHCNCYTNKKAD